MNTYLTASLVIIFALCVFAAWCEAKIFHKLIMDLSEPPPLPPITDEYYKDMPSLGEFIDKERGYRVIENGHE